MRALVYYYENVASAKGDDEKRKEDIAWIQHKNRLKTILMKEIEIDGMKVMYKDGQLAEKEILC